MDRCGMGFVIEYATKEAIAKMYDNFVPNLMVQSTIMSSVVQDIIESTLTETRSGTVFLLTMNCEFTESYNYDTLWDNILVSLKEHFSHHKLKGVRVRKL